MQRGSILPLLSALLSGPGPAAAQGVDLDMAAALLQSRDIAEVRGGIELLGVSQDRRAARFLAEYVRQGPPGPVIESVVESLAALGQPETLTPLLILAEHRRPGVRARVAEALAGLSGSEVRPRLERMLSDSDPSVRAAAARGLARAGNRQSIDVLFRAFEKGVSEASIAIGEIGGPDDADRLLGKLGTRPLPEILPGLQAFLNRGTFADAAKVRIIQRLQELATVEVRQFLEEWVAGLPRNYRGASRAAAEQAISRIAE
jgi:HEAT repeat protein